MSNNSLIKIESLRSESFLNKARATLTAEEMSCMTLYIESGGHAISPNVAANLYNLYLTGVSLYEIWKMNKNIPFGAIIESSVKYNWAEEQKNYSLDLHSKIRDRVVQSQLEATNLLTEMLTVMQKKNSEKFRRFIQSGNEKDLDGAINVESLNALLKVIDSLMKITGQDKPNKEEKRLVDIQSAPSQSRSVDQITSIENAEDLSSDDAAKVLEIFVNSKKGKKP